MKLLNLAVTFPQAPFVLLDDRSAREVFGVRFEEIRVIFYFEMVELQKGVNHEIRLTVAPSWVLVELTIVRVRRWPIGARGWFKVVYIDFLQFVS